MTASIAAASRGAASCAAASCASASIAAASIVSASIAAASIAAASIAAASRRLRFFSAASRAAASRRLCSFSTQGYLAPSFFASSPSFATSSVSGAASNPVHCARPTFTNSSSAYGSSTHDVGGACDTKHDVIPIARRAKIKINSPWPGSQPRRRARPRTSGRTCRPGPRRVRTRRRRRF